MHHCRPLRRLLHSLAILRPRYLRMPVPGSFRLGLQFWKASWPPCCRIQRRRNTCLNSTSPMSILLSLYSTRMHFGKGTGGRINTIVYINWINRLFSMQNSPTDTPSPSSDLAQAGTGRSPAPLQGKRRHVSLLLLFSMFSIAARYSPLSSPLPTPRCSTPTSPHPPEPTPMWTAGDEFLLLAKKLLDSTYASSLPSTVQSLLLLGYREIGIGAMAQAWAYTGMAVRMAQDLGMHRTADGWARVGMGRLFNARQLQERRRIWWGCVVLDGYVSTYIGRPLAIFERDHDTQFPNIDEVRPCLFQSGWHLILCG